MAWIKLDDQITQHQKFLKAGMSAWMWVGCLSYAQRFLTDGFVPTEAIASLLGPIPKPKSHIKKLLACRLLEKVKGGYQIHDYLDHNDSKAVVLEKRRIISEIRSEAGTKGARARWQKAWQLANDLPETDLANAARSVLPPSHPIPSYKEKNKLLSTDQLVSSKSHADLPDKAADQPAKVRPYDPATIRAVEKIKATERSRSHVRFR